MSEKQARVGIVIAVVKDQKVLLGLRQGSHGAGTWGSPGGHLDFGETVQECSVREAMEEIGVPITIVDERSLGWAEIMWETEGKHYISLYVLAKLTNENDTPILMEPTKCKEWRWFDKDELQTIPLMEKSHMCQALIKAIDMSS